MFIGYIRGLYITTTTTTQTTLHVLDGVVDLLAMGGLGTDTTDCWLLTETLLSSNTLLSDDTLTGNRLLGL
jgi:hypothetical protein